MTVGNEGNVLGATEYFTANPQVVVADVPTQGVRTKYAAISDLFAWVSVAGLGPTYRRHCHAPTAGC